jgi:hydroxypyruvate reductase
VSLADLQRTTTALLGAGAPITDINAVRKHLTELGGGGLLRRTRARVVALLVSDVVSDNLSVVGSGPCAADPTTYADALAVLARHAVEVPRAVRAHLEAGAGGARPETLKPGDPALERVQTVVIGNVQRLVHEACTQVSTRGRVPLIVGPCTCDVADVPPGLVYAEHLLVADLDFIVTGGEPTVRLPRRPGHGGRNQHLALLMAQVIRGSDRVFLAAGSDGTDGTTDAAGAVVDGRTWDTAVRLGLDPAGALAAYDSGRVHAALGTLVRTGPTGTNVLDLHLFGPRRVPARVLH